MAPRRTTRFTNLLRMYLPTSRSKSRLWRRCWPPAPLDNPYGVALMKKGIVALISGLIAAMLIVQAAVSQQSTPQNAEPAQTPAADAGLGPPRGARPTPPPPPPSVMPPPVTPIVSVTPPKPDPRVGLAPGRWDAAQAAWNMRLISTTPPSQASAGATHSDLAFAGKYAIQGS